MEITILYQDMARRENKENKVQRVDSITLDHLKQVHQNYARKSDHSVLLDIKEASGWANNAKLLLIRA